MTKNFQPFRESQVEWRALNEERHNTRYLKCLALRESERAPLMTHWSKRFLILLLSLRPGRLLAAVHPDLWAGEGGGRPAPPHHPPGAGGPGCVPDRPPGAHTRGCGPALCPGESPTASASFVLLLPIASLWLVGSNLPTCIRPKAQASLESNLAWECCWECWEPWRWFIHEEVRQAFIMIYKLKSGNLPLPWRKRKITGWRWAKLTSLATSLT